MTPGVTNFVTVSDISSGSIHIYLYIYMACVFWHSILAFYLTFSLTWALPDPNRERQRSAGPRGWCPLRSGARGWGPALPTSGACSSGLAVHTEIWSSQLRSGTAHWDLELGLSTEIWSSQLRPSSAHWDLELAVEFRQRPLRSGRSGSGRTEGGRTVTLKKPGEVGKKQNKQQSKQTKAS